jgi:nucleolar protein 56
MMVAIGACPAAHMQRWRCSGESRARLNGVCGRGHSSPTTSVLKYDDAEQRSIRKTVADTSPCVMSLYLLHESASGLALFEHVQSDAVGSLLQQAQDSVLDLSRFSRIVKMKAFLPFKSAENALSVINDVSEGILHEDLKNFLEANLPKVKKGSKNAGFHLGVNEPKLGNSITEQMSVPCKIDEAVTELMRGVRLHFSKLIKGLKDGDVKQAQLGLAHSFSRSKVKFNVNRVDNMIIQSIALLDQV